MSGRTERSRRILWLCLIYGGLANLTLAVFWPALNGDFINYDDPDYVTSNTHIQAGLSWANIVWAFTTNHAGNWHPLTWLSHTVDWSIFGSNPTGHHLTNILLHTANVLLVFGVLFELTEGMWTSAFVAALFAWHPMHVESVVWIAERKDVLSTFWWLWAILAYGRYTKAENKSPARRIYYSLALLCFTLGLLSKAMVVTLPFVLLLLDYWPLRRTRLLAPTPVKNLLVPVPWAKLIIEKIPFLVISVAGSVVTFVIQKNGGAVSALNALPLSARVENSVVAYVRYIGKLFWPENLAVLYPFHASWPIAMVAGAAILVAALSIVAVFAAHKRPYLAVGWFWFLGTLVPVIGLVQVGIQSMADRYSYIPSIGLFMMVAWGVSEISARIPQRAWVLGGAAAAVLIACVCVTERQIGYWQNSQLLFERAVAVTDDNYLAYNNVGYYLDGQGRFDEAMTNYKKSLSINPNYEEAENNYGHLLNREGKFEEAIGYFERALHTKPQVAETHNNFGNAYASLGRIDDAFAQYQLALKYDPENENALNNLGIVLGTQGRYDEAADFLKHAVNLKPTDPGAHLNLGNVFAAQHHPEAAVQEYQIATQLDPQNDQARNNLGNALMEEGKTIEARENYLAALQLNPANPEANYNIGLALLHDGKIEEAKKFISEAVRLRPNYTAAKNELQKLEAK